MPSIITVGGFFGDEGKGKIVAYLSIKDRVSIVARGGVGPNAGHTFSHEGKTYKVRMLPSAGLAASTRLLIGPGVLVNPKILLDEITSFQAQDRTFVDFQCGIIEDIHIEKDRNEDNLKSIGTTGTGTGPANAQRALRTLKMAKDIPELTVFLDDISNSLNYALDNNEKIIIEGTQGTYLSLYHGGYPYVTSKDVTASGICADVGLGPKKVDDVLVVFKSYVTRVGAGPLRNELNPKDAEKRGWLEFGSVTGRQRRAAPFDFELAKKSVRLNSATQIALTKIDVLFPECTGITEFDRLSREAQKFIGNVENETGVKVTLVGTGPDIGQIIDMRS